MKSENLPKIEVEQYDPNLEAQDEDVISGGNNRLTYILIGVIVALVVGYVALPKGNGNGLASVTPTFMLDDASVTATVPTAADSLAAGLKSTAVTKADDEETTAKTTREEHCGYYGPGCHWHCSGPYRGLNQRSCRGGSSWSRLRLLH